MIGRYQSSGALSSPMPFVAQPVKFARVAIQRFPCSRVQCVDVRDELDLADGVLETAAIQAIVIEISLNVGEIAFSGVIVATIRLSPSIVAFDPV